MDKKFPEIPAADGPATDARCWNPNTGLHVSTNDEVIAALDRLGRAANANVSHTATTSSIGTPAETDVKMLSEYIAELQKSIAVLRRPLDFAVTPGNPLLIVKIGSDAKGWIPGVNHFDSVRRVLKASKMDKRYNILLYHYAISTEIIGE